MRIELSRLASAALLMLLMACGGGGEKNVPASGAGSQRFLPLAVGNAWTYRIADSGGTGGTVLSTKTVTVEALETLTGEKAGISAYRMKTSRAGGASVAENLSWQQDTGTAVVRHLDRSFDGGGALVSSETYLPGKLRVDEQASRVGTGASWSEAYSERVTDAATGQTTTSNKTETWTVLASSERITVPAGTFDCLKVRRVSSVNGTPGSDKTFWFAKGVGKVKELGASRTEELQSFSLR